MIVKEKTMICSCGAVVLEERLIELNSGLLNAYFCPGGSTRQGRFQPPHYEVGRNLKDMTKLSSPIDAVNKKNDEEMEAIAETLLKAAKADKQLAMDMKNIHGEDFGRPFLSEFLTKWLGKFCHRVAVVESQEWILTTIDGMGGESLPNTTKIMPPAIQVNGVQFLQFELQDLIDLNNHEISKEVSL